jgi:glycosyltransferase involved in cell wall biosynthesis
MSVADETAKNHIMKITRIFYLIPDIREKFNFRKFIRGVINLDLSYIREILQGPNRPVGGIKMLYRHCGLLSSLGFCARPVLLGNFKITWFNYTARPVKIKKIGYKLNKDDIVVCPGTIPYEGLKFENAKKIIFIQNWINATSQRPWLRPQDMEKSYLELGYDKIITCGKYVTNFLGVNKKGDSTIITNALDHSRFAYKPELKEENRILFLSRKNLGDTKKIIMRVKKKFHSAKFIGINCLKEKEIIKQYQKADIFLATGYPEGFGLPPLEGMACGCAVVGFTGKGGDEYMIDGRTALVSRDGDTIDVAKKLVELLQNKELKETIRKNGYYKSKEYSIERMKKDLKNFYENFIKESK